MSISSELFHFVHDMSKAEKRIFRLRAAASGGKAKNYLQLFDLILGMREYNEEELKQRYERGELGKTFSWAKNICWIDCWKHAGFHLQEMCRGNQEIFATQIVWAGIEGH